ncbi:uncharacterized protein [Anolis sagrei]|uniref:uncharacterized protein isoform X1 n=1 Tax=Anolis sagrei TaxID=38937 RepID=UPI0035221ABE
MRLGDLAQEKTASFNMPALYARGITQPKPVSKESQPDLIQEIHSSQERIRLRPIFQKGPSPIKLAPLSEWLKTYPNRTAAAYLLQGFSHGFRIPAVGPRLACLSPNLKSVIGLEAIVKQKIDKEVREGRVLGPFPEPPTPHFRVSPLGIVPKKAAGEYRLIHHLSYPKGDSVNDAIPDEQCSVSYTSFDAAVRLLRQYGTGAELAKCDIKSAFRLLPVHPADFELLGFQFQGLFYMDRALPMGCSVSCAAFETFSTFLEWAVKTKAGLKGVVHYLDDFLFVGKGGSGDCGALLHAFQQLAYSLGVPLADEKTEGPQTVLTFLGIELDTVNQFSRLPCEKVEGLIVKIQQFLSKHKSTLREFQQVIGHLNFACKVIAPGRAFLRRLCDAISGASAPHHHIRVTLAIKADLRIWLQFLRHFNGISFWRQELMIKDALKVSSDASGAIGFGVYFNGHWCAERWPDDWHRLKITSDLTFLEFFPILVAVSLWGESFANSTVHFWCDNMATVQVINTLTSKSPRVMNAIRQFVLQCLNLNILFRAFHIAGLDNTLADALSRFQMERFRQLAPAADVQPERMPDHLWKAGTTRRH